jgi:hypothetical protein
MREINLLVPGDPRAKEERRMAAEKKEDLLTAGNIAKELGVPDGRVKKTINQLVIEPKAKKGACCYYTREDMAKIKEALK